MKKLSESFVEALNRAVAEAGNRYKFSVICGVNSGTLKYWQEGRSPSLDTIDALIPFLGGWPYLDGETSAQGQQEDKKRIIALEAENVKLREEILRLKGKVEAYKEMAQEAKGGGQDGKTNVA